MSRTTVTGARPAAQSAGTGSAEAARSGRGARIAERHRGWTTIAAGGGVGVVASAIACVLYRVWDAQQSVALGGLLPDTTANAMALKNVHRSAWFFTNPHLGAPFHQQNFDFPQAGETLQLVVAKVLATFSERPFLVMNVFYLLGFGALAAVTFWVLKALRFGSGIAATVALLYTFLPYHFWHQETHLYRSAYISAPIGALVILWVLSWRATFLHDPAAALRPWRALKTNLRWRRAAGALALMAAIAVIETITIAFVLVALMVGCVLVAIRDRDITVVVAGLLATAATGFVFAIALAPNLWYWHTHGTNDVAGRRVVAEQEIYGLKVSQLVLPNANSRVKALADLEQRAVKDSPLPYSEGGQTLGIIGAIGLLCCLYGGLRYGMRAGRSSAAEDRRVMWGHGGVLALVLILFASISGFALLLSLAGFSQIRTWNRAVVLIAFFAMVVVAIGLEAIVRRVRAKATSARWASAVSAALLVAVTAFGLWDTATPDGVPQPASTIRQVQVLQRFGHQLEQRLPRGSSIFQLPLMPYPEAGPVNAMQDYDAALPYIYTDGFNWSYGAMKGRPEGDWQSKVDVDDPIPQLRGLVGLGFDGILVDVYGYVDHGVSITAKLDSVLGQPSVVSQCGRWRLWDLRGYARSTGASTAALRRAATELVGPKLISKIPLVQGAPASS